VKLRALRLQGLVYFSIALSNVFAVDLYVSERDAFCSVTAALSTARTGDVVVSRTDTYREALPTNAPNVTLRGERGVHPVLVSTRETVLSDEHAGFCVTRST
jgi:hypothetical protein